jgi:hypothetical protein
MIDLKKSPEGNFVGSLAKIILDEDLVNLPLDIKKKQLFEARKKYLDGKPQVEYPLPIRIVSDFGFIRDLENDFWVWNRLGINYAHADLHLIDFQLAAFYSLGYRPNG